MKGITAVLIILVGSAILQLFAVTAIFGQSINSPNGYLALVGGTIYVSPTEEPIRNGVVLININDGKLAGVGTRSQVKIPQTAQVVDCAGRTITAGFWNSHVHFMERKWADVATIPAPELEQQLQDMLMRYGFTSVFDLSSMWENTRLLRDRIES